MAAEWSSQYEFLKKRLQSLRLQRIEYSSDEVRTLNSTLNNLENQLRLMSESPNRYDLVPSEVARRQLVLDYLKKQMADVKTMNSSTTRSNFTGITGGNGNGSSSSGYVSPSPKSEFNPMNTTDRGLVQRQKEVMKLQDDMIMEIETGLTSLHGKALAINEETKIHTRLLDDLDTNVDIATAALQAEAKHAHEIKEKAQVCYMYICIAVEVIVLVLLIILTVAG
eukprot:gene11248-7997_t